MAEIYLVKCVGLHGFESLSVLKRLPPGYLLDRPGYVEMFFDEARLMASLRHPNIAQVFDFGQDQDSYFFVMEYIEGANLRKLLTACRRRGEGMPLACAVQIVLGIAEGLHAAHQACGPEGQPLNLIHRDVSPTNIIVTGDGAIKVIDFGIAKSSNHRARTETGVVKGKYAYMSPEQCRAQVLDRRTDLFSLGVVLYELTTGARPQHQHRGVELLQRIVDEDSPDPRLSTTNYPDELAEIVNKMLHRDPAQRYQSARDVYEALNFFAAQHQMMLSPYQLASWVQELAQKKEWLPSAVQAEKFCRPPAWVNSVATAPTDVRGPTLGLDITHGRFARGTDGALRELAVASRRPVSRMNSLPYLELKVASDQVYCDDIFDDAELSLDDAEVLCDTSVFAGDSELDFDASAQGAESDDDHAEVDVPSTRSWKRSILSVLAASSIGSTAAVAVYLHLSGTELASLVDFIRQLAA